MLVAYGANCRPEVVIQDPIACCSIARSFIGDGLRRRGWRIWQCQDRWCVFEEAADVAVGAVGESCVSCLIVEEWLAFFPEGLVATHAGVSSEEHTSELHSRGH